MTLLPLSPCPARRVSSEWGGSVLSGRCWRVYSRRSLPASDLAPFLAPGHGYRRLLRLIVSFTMAGGRNNRHQACAHRSRAPFLGRVPFVLEVIQRLVYRRTDSNKPPISNKVSKQ